MNSSTEDPAKIQRSSLPFHPRLVNLSENILVFISIITARKSESRPVQSADPAIESKIL